MATVEGTQNLLGEYFNKDILAGEKKAFSLRALGTVENTNRGAEVKNIKIVSWDNVIFPSHPEAYMQKMVSESTVINDRLSENNYALKQNDPGMLIPITNQSVMNYLKHESGNIVNILKSFDTLYESSQLIDNNRRVRMVSKTGDIFIVNLEQYITNELDGYCVTRSGL